MVGEYIHLRQVLIQVILEIWSYALRIKQGHFFDFFSELGYSDVGSVNARCQVNCHIYVINSWNHPYLPSRTDFNSSSAYMLKWKSH